MTFIEQLERVAADACGPDWESRGVAALSAGAAALAAAFPLALLSFGSGTAQTGTSVATTVVSGGTGKGGWLTGIGKGKITAAGTGVLTAGTLCWLVLQSPDIGGTSAASYEQWFSNAALVTRNQSIPQGSKAGPGARYRLSVTPARTEHGTHVTLRIHFEARATWGLIYLSEGNYRCDDPDSDGPGTYHQAYTVGMADIFTDKEVQNADNQVWLYPAGRTDSVSVRGPALRVPAKLTSDKGQGTYRISECAWIFAIEGTFTFRVPDTVKPGEYLISAFDPPGLIDSAKRGSSPVSLEDAGLRTEGGLPRFTVLG